MHLLRSTALCSALLGASLVAQTNLSGSVYDGNGGPLVSGAVYHVTGNINVPANQTLTVQPGAIVKFATVTFTVDGGLVVNGTAGNPAVFTSVRDDSAGGDTNGDGGATSPAPGNWYGINVRSNAGSLPTVMDHVRIRYCGAGSWDALMAQPDVTMRDSIVTDCARGGLNFGSGTRPTVERCHFERIAVDPAISGLHFEAVPGLLDNTAANCSGGNFALVNTPSVDNGNSVTIGMRNLLGGALVCGGNAIVRTGASLTLAAGVTYKTTGTTTFTIDGTLTCNGSSAMPVVFTSFSDDTAAGDTNGDGNATSPAAGNWYGLNFRAGSDASTLAFTHLRYTGAGAWEALEVANTDITLTDCTVSDTVRGGLEVSSAARPTVERCRFERCNGQPAIFGVDLDALGGFLDNTATDCGGGNYLLISAPSSSGNVHVQRRNVIDDLLVLNGNATVTASSTLTIDPGVIVKQRSQATITIDGTLLCNGTAADPVIFTSFADDSAGGDTNLDGPSTGAPGNWYGINFRAGAAASILDHTEVRFCGAGGWAGMIVAADVTVRNCRIADANRGGISCNTSVRPVIEDCHFERIAGIPAISGVSIDAVPGLKDNTAANCPGGGFVSVLDTTCGARTNINARNQINGALVLTNNFVVQSSGHLTLNAGVVFKMQSAQTMLVDGRLDTNGPVIFTHLNDDAFGGDTNGDGNATMPSPGLWYGLDFRSGATGFVDRLLVRWSGAGGWNGILCDAPGVSLVRSRVEFGARTGFTINTCQSARGLTAFANAFEGIVLGNGNFDLIRSTAAFNGREGIRRAAAWTGSVRSSISKFNTGTDFSGFSSGEVQFCDGGGIVGGAGNLDVDPLFVSAAAGDLRLTRLSPCVDRGAPGDVTNDVDALGFPRYLDGDLDGAQRIDMGAHEFDNTLLFVTGDPSPGSTLTATVASEPAIQLGVLAYGFGPPAPIPLFNLGAVYFDLGLPYDAFVVGTNSNTQIPIPNGILTPLRIVFQYIGIVNPFPRGNTSNPAYVEIR